MAKVIVLLSGPVASGKSTLAQAFTERYGAVVISTHQLLEDSARATRGEGLGERASLQGFGEALDVETGGAWVAEMIEGPINEASDDSVIVVDAVRRREQIEAIRQRFGRQVAHIHLDAPIDELAARYPAKQGIRELASYEAVRANATEAAVPELKDVADVAINTARSTADDVVVRAAARLGLLPRLDEQLVDVLIGGQYGSEGKGNVAFYLAPEYDVLVRVGGPNAGHKVPTNPVATHRSLPSGALANLHARIVIGPGAVLNETVLLDEIVKYRVDPGRVSIDPQVMLISDEDIAAEQKLGEVIGSTKQGVGAATARRITGREGVVQLASDSSALKPMIRETQEILAQAYADGQRILLEGTQGTSLSLFHGSYPHVTSRDTTAAGCLAEAGINPRRTRRVVVVCRTYPIRVGGPSGPMGKEITWETVAERSGLAVETLRGVEVGSVTSKQRRVAEFDWVQLRNSAELNGATDIALTFADYHRPDNEKAYRYDQLHRDTIRFVEEIESVTGSPVSLIAARFAQRSLIDRRTWRGHVPSPDGGSSAAG